MQVITGAGKTKYIIEEIAAWLREHPKFVPLIYMVPMHKLGEEVREQFIDLGIDARIFRGYLAPDPNNPLNIEAWKIDPNTPREFLKTMCKMPERVRMAIRAQLKISKACCRQGKHKCPHLEGADICPFQAQNPGKG
jgi:hypothetical protein